MCPFVEELHGLSTTQTTPVVNVMEHWLPPDPGWHKANAYGSFLDASGDAGGARGTRSLEIIMASSANATVIFFLCL